MKIEKILFTCNENKEYAGFWNSISAYYNSKDITPVLFFIGDPSKYDLDTSNGEVRPIKPIKGVPTRIQALWGKFHFTSTEPETTWIIGDLDLYQLDIKHFDIPQQCDYAHLNEHGYYSKSWREGGSDLPGYYHVAKGKTFTEIFGLNVSFDIQTKYIRDHKYGIGLGVDASQLGPDGEYQCCEENLSTEILRKQTNLQFFGKTLPQTSRLHRKQITISMEKIKSRLIDGTLQDMHCPRPYEKYSERIEAILALT